MLQKAPVPDWRSTEKKAALEMGSRNENDELENENACTLKKETESQQCTITKTKQTAREKDVRIRIGREKTAQETAAWSIHYLNQRHPFHLELPGRENLERKAPRFPRGAQRGDDEVR